jgi:hypothetical protein
MYLASPAAVAGTDRAVALERRMGRELTAPYTACATVTRLMWT